MIKIRLALIPPYRNVNIVQRTDYQLLLPQCLSNGRYVRAYQRARHNGSYMILDNGVAEGLETDPGELVELARRMMVNEVVIPDTIGDAEATLKQAYTFKDAPYEFNYMGVVQGSSFGECTDCIKGFKAMKYITTLGIPRHLLDIGEGMRFSLVDYIRLKYGSDYAIHLLGMNRKYTNELISYGSAYRAFNVRGIDTSTPFIYAMHGAALTDYKMLLERPEDYFDRSIDNKDLNYINLVIMKDWAYGNV